MVEDVFPSYQFLRERPVFLWMLFAIPAMSTFGHALAPEKAVIKGQDLGIVLNLVLALISIGLWVPYRRREHWPARVYLFLGLLALTWLYELVRIQLDQSLFNMTAITVLVSLALIALKPVEGVDLGLAIRILAYSLILVALVSLILDVLGWMPEGFLATDLGGGRLLILDLLGAPARWSGPFGNVNYASPIGGLVVVIGFSQRRLHKWIICLGGLGILALGQGRTALFATVAGLLVLLLWNPAISRARYVRQFRWFGLGGAIGIGVFYVLALDRTLNGRTPIWSDFIQLWPRSPLLGIGDSGITEYVTSRNGTGLITHTHAHSVVLDGLVRFGVVMAVLTLAIFGIALAAGITALPTRGPGPLAVVVFIIIAGSAETIHSWKYWSVYVAALIWAVLEGGQQERRNYQRPGLLS